MNPHQCAPFLIPHHNVNPEMRYQSVSGLCCGKVPQACVQSLSSSSCAWPDSPVLPHSTADL